MGEPALVCGLALAWLAWSQEPAGERGTSLARVPEGLKIPDFFNDRASRGSIQARGGIAWSADGRLVAYTGEREGRYVPVVGAELGAEYDFVGPPSVAGGHAFFHVVRKKDDDQEQHWLWIDGKAIGPEDWMGDHVVRPDGEQVLVWTNPGARFGPNAVATGEHVLLKATHKGSQWSLSRSDDWFEPGPIRFAGEQAYAAAIERGKGWTVFRAEKREETLFEPCEGIESFALAPNGVCACIRTRQFAGRTFVTSADAPELFLGKRRVGKNHGVVSTATLDPAGERVAYVVTREEGRTVAVGDEGAPHGSYGFVLELAFSPTGERLAFVAVRGGTMDAEVPGCVAGGQWCAVVRGVAPGAEPSEQSSFLEVRDLRWDARGGRLAYAARDEAGWRVIAGDTKSEPHTDVGPPVFSADGKTLSFGSRDGDELWWRELTLP